MIGHVPVFSGIRDDIAVTMLAHVNTSLASCVFIACTCSITVSAHSTSLINVYTPPPEDTLTRTLPETSPAIFWMAHFQRVRITRFHQIALWEDPKPRPGPTISEFGLPFIISRLSPYTLLLVKLT